MSADDPKSKRRLRLMNEVLPQPDRSSKTGPRARTLAHMQRLLAATAAAGALGGACTKEATHDAVRTGDPSKDRATLDSSGASAAATQAQNTTGTAPEVVTNEPTRGYAVVDPLPAPQCVRAAERVTATGAWKAAAGGGMAIEVRLHKEKGADFNYSRKSKPEPSGAKVAAFTISGGDVLVTLVPDKGVTTPAVQLPIDCSTGSAHLNVQIDLTNVPPNAPPPSGTPVNVSVYDTY